LRLRSLLPAIVASLIMSGGALSGWPRSFAAELPWLVPVWLQAHVGEGEGHIPPAVLQKARALYLKKVSEGAVNNSCYFAMDATRPGGFGRRFCVICEADRTFLSVPSGHGSGLNLEGIADFANGIRCAKNFSNAMDSKLTTGGPYVTKFSFGARDRLLDEFGILADYAGCVSSAMELSRCVIRYLTRNGVGMSRRLDVKPGRRTNFSILNAQDSKDGRISFFARPFD